MTFATLCLFVTQFVLFLSTALFLFRRGEHNLSWFVSTLPFALNQLLLAGFYLGYVPAFVDIHVPAYQYVVGFASVLCACSIGLFWFAAGSHRVTVPMFHQSNDSPAEVVTWGAYRFIRHPFYTSYIVYFVGCILVAPSWLVIANCIYWGLVLSYTAAKEERELLALEGETYRKYLDETGRFWPPLRAFRELVPPPPRVVQGVYHAGDTRSSRKAV